MGPVLVGLLWNLASIFSHLLGIWLAMLKFFISQNVLVTSSQANEFDMDG